MLETTIPMAASYQVQVADADTDLDSLRDDPRFQRMLSDAKKRLGIAEAVPAS
jgi:adenylate cyclase